MNLSAFPLESLACRAPWRAQRSRQFYGARRELCRHLDRAGAADWHASGTRSKFDFLFNASCFNQVLEFLNTGATYLYRMLASLDELEVPSIRASWHSILHANPELRAAWDVESARLKPCFALQTSWDGTCKTGCCPALGCE